MIRDVAIYLCDECEIVSPMAGFESEKPVCISCEKPMQRVTFYRLGTTGETKHLFVSSGYGANTKKPFITIESADIDKPIQLSPADARSFALNILEAADGAESDGFIVEFFKDEMGQDENTVGHLLIAFRKWRNEHRETSAPSQPAEDL